MVSIVIPVYNAEKKLRPCVNSLLAQTFLDFELLLIDDGSKDDSGRICDGYAAKDNRVKVVHKENGGVSDARNCGLETATGEYVMFLDSDDAFVPNACEVLLKTLNERNADCVVCGTKEPSGYCWVPGRNHDYGSLADFRHDFAEWLGSELLSPVWNKIYRKEKITEMFSHGMSFGEDLAFNLAYFKNCDRISFITDVLHFHDNARANSLTHKFNPERFKDIERIQKVVLGFAGTETAPRLFRKYVRDSINYMYSVYSTSLMSATEKKKLLKDWYEIAYLKNLDTSAYTMTNKERLMLSLWKKRWYLLYDALLRVKRKLV